MAVIKFTNSKSSIKKVLEYITQPLKTEERLISGKDCMPETALQEMMFVKELYKKKTGRNCIHIIQSFDPKDDLTYKKANDIGIQLAERFEGFQAVIATHKDRNHIHNHILLNSVNFETGYKFQQSKKEMQEVKDFSDELCLKYGLSIIQNPKNNTDIERNEYQTALKGESWKLDLILAIEAALKISKSQIDFISNMNRLGYKVNWLDNHKYITYTTPNGKKCRDNKLHDKKYLREEMESELRKIETNTIGEAEYKRKPIVGYLHSNREPTEADKQQSKTIRGCKKESVFKRLEIEKYNIKNRESEKRSNDSDNRYSNSKYYSHNNNTHDILD